MTKKNKQIYKVQESISIPDRVCCDDAEEPVSVAWALQSRARPSPRCPAKTTRMVAVMWSTFLTLLDFMT